MVANNPGDPCVCEGTVECVQIGGLDLFVANDGWLALQLSSSCIRFFNVLEVLQFGLAQRSAQVTTTLPDLVVGWSWRSMKYALSLRSVFAVSVSLRSGTSLGTIIP